LIPPKETYKYEKRPALGSRVRRVMSKRSRNVSKETYKYEKKPAVGWIVRRFMSKETYKCIKRDMQIRKETFICVEVPMYNVKCHGLDKT